MIYDLAISLKLPHSEEIVRSTFITALSAEIETEPIFLAFDDEASTSDDGRNECEPSCIPPLSKIANKSTRHVHH